MYLLLLIIQVIYCYQMYIISQPDNVFSYQKKNRKLDQWFTSYERANRQIVKVAQFYKYILLHLSLFKEIIMPYVIRYFSCFLYNTYFIDFQYPKFIVFVVYQEYISNIRVYLHQRRPHKPLYIIQSIVIFALSNIYVFYTIHVSKVLVYLKQYNFTDFMCSV